jgi:hypothetical protein
MRSTQRPGHRDAAQESRQVKKPFNRFGHNLFTDLLVIQCTFSQSPWKVEMMTPTKWVSYIRDLSGTAGAAIISLDGARCAAVGEWAATSLEELSYTALISNIPSAKGKDLTYGGKRFVVTRAIEDAIFAQFGSEGLIFGKSVTVIVAAHHTSRQIGSEVSEQVAKVVANLCHHRL